MKLRQWRCGHNDTVIGIRQSGPRKGKPYTCCLTCVRLRNAARTPEEQWRVNLSRYGVTPTWYNTKFEEQGGLCAICRRPETVIHKGKLLRLAVDHNHETNEPRGLLCCACNRAIGLFQDSILVFEAAIAYARKYAT